MLNKCTDYDSMGDYSRFPQPKVVKGGIFNRIVKSINNFFYVKRR